MMGPIGQIGDPISMSERGHEPQIWMIWAAQGKLGNQPAPQYPAGSADNFPPEFWSEVSLIPDSADDQGGHASLCGYRHRYAPPETHYFRHVSN